MRIFVGGGVKEGKLSGRVGERELIKSVVRKVRGGSRVSGLEEIFVGVDKRLVGEFEEMAGDVETGEGEGGGRGVEGGEGEEDKGGLGIDFEVGNMAAVVDETETNFSASIGGGGVVGVLVGGGGGGVGENVGRERTIKGDLLSFFSEFRGDNC